MAVKNGTNGNDFLTDLEQGYIFLGGQLRQIWTDRFTNDTINGLEGHDQITLNGGHDFADGGGGNDTIIDSGTGDDLMFGRSGSDHFYIGTGNNYVDGGYDNDWVYYVNRTENVLVDLERGYGRGHGQDRLISIENAFTGPGHDVIVGSSLGNSLLGGYGNDHIMGMRGDDRIQGGPGDDRLTGDGTAYFPAPPRDTDRDTFVFTSLDDFSGYDVIVDFRQGEDRIDVSAIDTNPDTPIDDFFTFDTTPDGSTEEWWDGLEFPAGFTVFGPPDDSPIIEGDPGEIEYRHHNGNTYIYLSLEDGDTNAEIMLVGIYHLRASDFMT
jgi:Ca2+-binding RTX toxin-like protein